ncbi:MAG TPA: hypothetical protein VK898_20415, partial [Chloroflexota bacterium]|nr:hypothetical protein [Chloroflexota bacterium]
MTLDSPNRTRIISRRQVLLAAARGGMAVTVGSLLAACGQPASAPPSAPAPAATNAPQPAGAAAPQAGPGGFANVGTLK